MVRIKNSKPIDTVATAAKPRGSRRGVVAVEAALVLPIVLVLMMGIWQVGHLMQVSQTLTDAATEGARLAAGGSNNTTSLTVAMVQQAVQDYLTAAGFPPAAVSGAQIQVINRSPHAWTDPGDAQPLDPFAVSVTIPPGPAFDSLCWVASTIAGINQLSVEVEWFSARDSQVVVNSQLPY